MKFDPKKLSKVRKEKKMSTYAFARELSKSGLTVSHQTIINWEKGIHFPNCHHIAEICMFCGKSPLYFFN